jgi:hypothetical protein
VPTPDVAITVFDPDTGPRDITLSYPLRPEHEALLRSLHDSGNRQGLLECREHDHDPQLRDLRSDDGRLHEAWLLIREIQRPEGRRLILAHWPNSPVKGSHMVPTDVTDEHKARQEYIAPRGEDFGYDVHLDEKLPTGCRPDVTVDGPAARLGARIQRRSITTATVLRQTDRAHAAGVTSVWFPDADNPAKVPWAFRAPTVLTNRRDDMARNSWTVTTGPRVLQHERCVAGSRIPCPDGRNHCGRWHPLWTPKSGVTVDDVVREVPAGELLRLDTRTRQGVILVSPADHHTWISDHAPFIPTQRSSSDALPRHSDYTAAQLRQRLESDRADTRANRQATGMRYPPCRDCGQPIFLVRPGRERCAACAPDLAPWARIG